MTAADNEGAYLHAGNDRLLHDTQVLKELVFPWVNIDHTTCANSLFSSVQFTVKLKKIGLQCVKAMKTVMKKSNDDPVRDQDVQ
jgi:hypothetical protein